MSDLSDAIKGADLPPNVLRGRTVTVKVGDLLPEGIFCAGWRVGDELYLIVGEQNEMWDESECPGHESTDGPIGNVTYCDGSCQNVGPRTIDEFGNIWTLPADELCPRCGQPDNCGDCTHGALSYEDVLQLGGVPGPAARASRPVT